MDHNINISNTNQTNSVPPTQHSQLVPPDQGLSTSERFVNSPITLTQTQSNNIQHNSPSSTNNLQSPPQTNSTNNNNTITNTNNNNNPQSNTNINNNTNNNPQSNTNINNNINNNNNVQANTNINNNTNNIPQANTNVKNNITTSNVDSQYSTDANFKFNYTNTNANINNVNKDTTNKVNPQQDTHQSQQSLKDEKDSTQKRIKESNISDKQIGKQTESNSNKKKLETIEEENKDASSMRNENNISKDKKRKEESKMDNSQQSVQKEQDKSIHSKLEEKKRRKLVTYNDSNQEKASRIFIKKLERNMNNSLNLEPTVNNNRASQGYVLKIYSIDGVYDNKINQENKGEYFIRFHINMYDDYLHQFIGNIYKSPLIRLDINDHRDGKEIFLKMETPCCSYFLCKDRSEKEEKEGTNTNKYSQYYLLIQVILVRKNSDDVILNQICKGWTYLNPLNDKEDIDINSKAGKENKAKSKVLYQGTPREILYKSFVGLKRIDNTNFHYELFKYDQLMKVKSFLPDFINLGGDEMLPGLISGCFPKNPDGSENEVDSVTSDELIISNVKIEMDTHLEEDILKYAEDYYKHQYGDEDKTVIKKIYIKERRLKCGLHNTWCFINSNGLENSISLINSHNNSVLRCRGRLNIDKFFVDDTSSVALILELGYTVQIPIVPDKKYEVIYLPIGYSIFIPTRENVKGEVQSAYFVTGPGTTVYGDHLWEPPKVTERTMTIEFNLVQTGQSLDNSKVVDLTNELDDSKLKEMESRFKSQEQNIDKLKNQNNKIMKENRELRQQLALYKSGDALPQQRQPVPSNKPTIPLDISQIGSEVGGKVISENEIKLTQELLKSIQIQVQKEVLINKQEKEDDILYDRFQSDIPRNDQAKLIEQKMLSLIIENFSSSTLEYYLKQELLGKIGQKIRFEFLTYKPPKEQTPIEGNIPQRLRFDFSFWTSHNLSSEIGRVLRPEEYIDYYNNPLLIVPENQYLNIGDTPQKIYVEVEYDSSVEKGIDLKEFISYLLIRQLPIQVYDVDRHFLIGVIKVPLKDLLRSGKPQMISNKEYEILDNELNIKGYIQMSLINNELFLRHKYNYDDKAFQLVSSDDSITRLRQKKKVRVRAMNNNQIKEGEEAQYNSILNKANDMQMNLSKGSLRNFRLDVESEKKLRVMKYFNQKNNKDSYKIQLEEERLEILKNKKAQDEEYYKNLNRITQIRNMEKDSILSKVNADSHKNSFRISLIQGKPHYFNYVVKNETDIDELYHIVISVDKSIEEEKEIPSDDKTITIVNYPEQWKKVVKYNKLIPPNDYDIINIDNFFKIHAGESVPLAIRLLSYTQTQSSKSYTIWIHKKNGEPLYYLMITIDKVFPVIDHIFTFNIPCNQESVVSVINPFKYDRKKTTELIQNLMVSQVEINISENVDTSDFQFKYKAKEEGSSSYFLIFFYTDELKIKLYLTWKIELNSLISIERKTRLGECSKNTLSIDNTYNEPIRFQLYSENLSLVTLLKDVSDLPFTLKPHEQQTKQFYTYPKRTNDRMCLITCVMRDSGVLYSRWLIHLKLEKPKVDEVVKVICRAKNNTNISFTFKNELKKETVYYFSCEETKYLTVADEKMSFEGGERKYISMIIPPQRYLSKKEVLVFAYSEDYSSTRIINFQIYYK